MTILYKNWGVVARCAYTVLDIGRDTVKSIIPRTSMGSKIFTSPSKVSPGPNFFPLALWARDFNFRAVCLEGNDRQKGGQSVLAGGLAHLDDLLAVLQFKRLIQLLLLWDFIKNQEHCLKRNVIMKWKMVSAICTAAYGLANHLQDLAANFRSDRPGPLEKSSGDP